MRKGGCSAMHPGDGLFFCLNQKFIPLVCNKTHIVPDASLRHYAGLRDFSERFLAHRDAFVQMLFYFSF